MISFNYLVLENLILHTNFEKLFEFSLLLSRMSSNKRYIDILLTENFQGFIQKLFELSAKLLKTAGNENIAHHIMNFWKNLVSYSVSIDLLKQVLIEICKIYIEYLLNNQEMSVEDGMFDENIAILSSLSKCDYVSITNWVSCCCRERIS